MIQPGLMASVFVAVFSLHTLFLQNARAQTIEIGNQHLSVRCDDESAEIRATGDEHLAIEQLRFPWSASKIEERATNDATWGRGQAIVILGDNGWQTTLTLYDASPFLHCRTRVRASKDAPYQTNVLTLASWNANVGVDSDELRVVGTGGLSTLREAKGSYAFSAIADPKSRRGIVAGWLTHLQGVGVFFPTASGDKAAVRSQIDFGNFRVAAGQLRDTEILLIGCFDDVRLGLEAYADAVAQQHKIKLADKPGVYCTWYHAGASDERKLAANTRFAAEHLQPFGLSVIQIDDKWQSILPSDSPLDVNAESIKTTGPIKVFADANKNFPGGMAATAKMITDSGLTPGIWFMPFAGNLRNPYFDADIFATNPDGTPFHDSRWSGTCIDLSHPKGESFVRERVARIYDWGYRYFKIDGMHTGIPSYNIYVNTFYTNSDFGKARLHDPHVTHAQAYRKGLRILREEAPGVFILGCNVSQNMRSMGPAFGLIDAMRIGPDNGAAGRGQWDQVVKGAWHGTNLYFLNGRVWHNDPDPVYVREGNPLASTRWMCSWMAVAGAMHTSSEQYDQLAIDRLDILKRCLPSHSLPARPVDYLESDNPRIWTVRSPRATLVGLFNWHAKQPDEIRCPLAKMDLDPHTTYVGFDYWENRFVAPFQSELQRLLGPGTCQIIALRAVADRPQVISTSRHITQGLIDIVSERWDADTHTLSGTSRVVAEDEYELRVVLPADRQWTVKSAQAESMPMQITRNSTDPGNTIRASFRPQATGDVKWTIAF